MRMGCQNWTNPTEHTVKLKLFHSPGRFDEYVIPPKGTASIPNEYTAAIHQVRNGVIIGGCAPQLVREGQTEQLHSVLAAPSEPERPGPGAAERSGRKVPIIPVTR
jgi:hypothetical protein